MQFSSLIQLSELKILSLLKVVCLFASLCLALLFSATFKKKVEMLCRDILTDPIRVVVGELGEVINNRLRKKRHISCT